MLGPSLFTLYINCLDFNIVNARFYFYANDTVIYCMAPSMQQSLGYLQSAFDIIQARICVFKLVLNVEKNSKTSLDSSSALRTSRGEFDVYIKSCEFN